MRGEAGYEANIDTLVTLSIGMHFLEVEIQGSQSNEPLMHFTVQGYRSFLRSQSFLSLNCYAVDQQFHTCMAFPNLYEMSLVMNFLRALGVRWVERTIYLEVFANKSISLVQYIPCSVLVGQIHSSTPDPLCTRSCTCIAQEYPKSCSTWFVIWHGRGRTEIS